MSGCHSKFHELTHRGSVTLARSITASIEHATGERHRGGNLGDAMTAVFKKAKSAKRSLLCCRSCGLGFVDGACGCGELLIDLHGDLGGRK